MADSLEALEGGLSCGPARQANRNTSASKVLRTTSEGSESSMPFLRFSKMQSSHCSALTLDKLRLTLVSFEEETAPRTF